jgi:hypothetical protein
MRRGCHDAAPAPADPSRRAARACRTDPRNFAQNGLCDAPKRGSAARRRSGRTGDRIRSCRSSRCAADAARRVGQCFAVQAAGRAGIGFQRAPDARSGHCRHARMSCMPRADPAPPSPAAAGARKKCHGVVDTAKNRDYVSPSRRCLRKRVSRPNATTRVTTKPSARTVSTVDSGIVSLEKPRHHPEHTARVAPATRVFCCRATARRRTESVPGRSPSRRLAAGPTPAALFPPGRYIQRVH